jgi:hypothetical protein
MIERENWPAPIVFAVAGALKPALGENGLDIVPDGHLRALYVCADEWTVNIEWARDVAWLAIDDEPDDPASFERARRAVMSAAVEEAWRSIDAELGGYMVDALIRSGDPFSIAFANAISVPEEHGPAAVTP